MPTRFPAKFLTRFLKIWQLHADFMHHYQPAEYLGNVIYFSHTEIIPDFPTDQYAHWKKYFVGDSVNYHIQGTHISMNANPNVKLIAEYISEHSNKVTSGKLSMIQE